MLESSLNEKEITIRLKQENFIKNGIYHFYNRCVDGELLCRHDADYRDFLKRFKKAARPFDLSVFAYCIMPNHFHFLLRQDSEEPINRLFNSLLSGYVQHFNRKYHRVGRLMSNKLQHKAITSEYYLGYVIRYIHRNPIRAGLIKQLTDWEFSNYPEWIGIRNGRLFDPTIRAYYHLTPGAYRVSMESHIDRFDYRAIKDLLMDFED